MSTFKRNSSRFSKGDSAPAETKENNSRSYSRGRTETKTQEETPAERTSSRSSSSRGSYNRDNKQQSGGKGQYQFSRIGSLTVPKKVSDEAHDWIMDNLRGNEDIRLNCKVYLPKGVDSVTLSKDDLVVLSFKVSDKDKEFVVGHLLLPNDSE